MDDAEELERLGHQGISGNLNRDKEADLSIQTEMKNRRQFYGKTAGLSVDMSLHPLVSFLFGVPLLVLGLYLVSLNLGNPSDRLPEQLRAWPSVTATVEHSVAHPERYGTKYDMTFRYKVAGKSYWFKEDAIATEIHLSEVKYDSQRPSHFCRVPLQAESWAILLPFGFVTLIGMLFCFGAMDKWRSGNRSYNKITSLLFLIAALGLYFVEFIFYFNPHLQKGGHPPAAPYKVASSTDPG